MALPVSTLSQVCRSIADFVSARLDAPQNNIQVRIGSPAAAAPADGETQHRVNLFFYRVEPNGFGPAAAPGETWLLRLCCLVTSFGVDENQVSAGENDLRLMGGVLQAFHERPILDAITVNNVALRAEVLFQPLVIEDINHLWATQGDVAYRPSVAYEVALVPIVPRQPTLGGPLVGTIGFEVRADDAGRRDGFRGQAAPPAVRAMTIDTHREDWAPRICFVIANACVESVSFAVGSPELSAFDPRVWVAGTTGAPVQLRWELWDAANGWRRGGTDVAAAAIGESRDPDLAGSVTTTPVALPFADHAGQAVLYAERTFHRGADHAPITVRSNPLLVNLF